MNIDKILRASLCAFGQSIFDYFSLEDDEFARALDSFLIEADCSDMLQDYAYQFDYDLGDIINAKERLKCSNNDFDYIEAMNCGRAAFSKTIFEDKTINAEAFMDNLINEFNKNYK